MNTNTPSTPPLRPAVVVRASGPIGVGEWRFTGPFCVGRGEHCDVRISHQRVSRRHAEVIFEQGRWWLKDLGSANGTFIAGQRVETVALEDGLEATLGPGGLTLRFSLETSSDTSRQVPQDVGEAEPAIHPALQKQKPNGEEVSDSPLDRGYVEAHYFGDADRPAGDRTRLIRQTYQDLKEQQRQRWLVRLVGGGAAAAILIVLVGGYAVWQQIRVQQIEARAASFFEDSRALETAIIQLRNLAVLKGDVRISEQLDGLRELRSRRMERYGGFIEEFGRRRRLTEDEQAIYKKAHIFNESAFEMPPAFVRRVRESIRDYWQTPAGRQRFIRAIRTAKAKGYDRMIARTMLRYDLPPEFFYLALVESNFDERAVGPKTRVGYAKGMWQFIPETGMTYGLAVGPRQHDPIYDPADERHDPEKSTDAAARYLLDIHGQLAGASALLAMASYNWGEHRVVDKLKGLVEAGSMAGDVAARSYWHFYTHYGDRMPEETKDYVARIFAASVIGENPSLFGFDELENPLKDYLSTSELRVP